MVFSCSSSGPSYDILNLADVARYLRYEFYSALPVMHLKVLISVVLSLIILVSALISSHINFVYPYLTP